MSTLSDDGTGLAHSGRRSSNSDGRQQGRPHGHGAQPHDLLRVVFGGARPRAVRQKQEFAAAAAQGMRKAPPSDCRERDRGSRRWVTGPTCGGGCRWP